MRTWNCKQCGDEMNLGMCQQSGMHVGCYPAWHETKIRVWRVEHDGASFVDSNPETVADMIREMDDGTVYTIEATKMAQGEYEQLPEFTGF